MSIRYWRFSDPIKSKTRRKAEDLSLNFIFKGIDVYLLLNSMAADGFKCIVHRNHEGTGRLRRKKMRSGILWENKRMGRLRSRM